MTTPPPTSVWATAQQLCDRYQISRTTWWRWSTTSGFPTPIRFGRTVRWDINAVETYLTRLETNQEGSAHE